MSSSICAVGLRRLLNSFDVDISSYLLDDL